MGVEQAMIEQIEMRSHHATTCMMGQACSQFVVTICLLAYGGYVTWENWRQLLQFMATPALADLAMVIMAIQMIASMLPGLSYAVIYLSRRQDAPWFLRAGALFMLGLVTAAIEMLVHFIG